MPRNMGSYWEPWSKRPRGGSGPGLAAHRSKQGGSAHVKAKVYKSKHAGLAQGVLKTSLSAT